MLVAAFLFSAASQASGQSYSPTHVFQPTDSVATKLEELWRDPKVPFVCLYGEMRDSTLAVSRVETANRFSLLIGRACRGAVSFAAFRRNEESTTERKMLEHMKEHNIDLAVLVINGGREYKLIRRQE